MQDNINSEIARAIVNMINETRKVTDAFRLNIRPWIEFKSNIEKQILGAIPKIVEFQKSVYATFKEINYVIEKLPEVTKHALRELANHGWFFNSRMPFTSLWELESAISYGKIEEAEALLINYFNEQLDGIEDDLKTAHPNRAVVLKSAFDAHRRGDYYLSIPVFLAQSDGICQELIGIQLFQKKRKTPVISEYVNSITQDIFRAAFLYPLTQPLPISASVHERENNFTGLNRHQVLHGESTDYGTENNSCKAISLLSYVSSGLRDAQK